MERLAEFEAKQIPKTIFFIWMGRKKFPKQDENPDAAPPEDGRFRRGTVNFSVQHNKDCEATMWLDILSMVDDHIIETAIADQRLKNKYFRWSRIARTPGTPKYLQPQPNFFPDDGVILQDPQNFEVIVDMLRAVRRQFAHWMTKPSHWALLLRHTRRVDDMITWCRATGLRVRYLDTDAYLKWMDADPRSTEYSLVNWVFFELYFRGSNFGASGDMLRALILYERGGMYCDHDDKLNWMNNKVTLKLTHKTSKYLGFKHCLILKRYETHTGQSPGTGFLAAPQHHPFVAYFRDSMLGQYQKLLADNYRWLKDTRQGPQDNAPGMLWFDFRRGTADGIANFLEFAGWAIMATGPDRLVDCLREMDDYLRSQWFSQSAEEPRVRGSFSNSWLTQ